MHTNIPKSLLSGLLPLLTNPATLTLVGLSILGLTLRDILSEKAQESGSQAVPNGSEPLGELLSSNRSNGPESLKATDRPSLREPEDHAGEDGELEPMRTAEPLSQEDLKKEVIRQAMSELGKRSGAARRRNKEGG